MAIVLPPESGDLDVKAIATAFVEARKSNTALTEFPGGFIPDTLELGYAIQAEEIKQWDDEVVAWKVGGVPPELREKYQETRLAGPVMKKNLFKVEDGGHVKLPVFGGGCSAIEVEFVMELGDLSDLPSEGVTVEQAIGAINRVYMGYENASSPLSIGNDFGPLGPISDFGLNNGVIIGPELVDWTPEKLLAQGVTTTINGTEVHKGNPKPGLDGPFGAVRFLIEFLKKNNYDTSPGVLVSTGVVTGVHVASAGDKAELSYDGQCSFSVELVDINDL